MTNIENVRSKIRELQDKIWKINMTDVKKGVDDMSAIYRELQKLDDMIDHPDVRIMIDEDTLLGNDFREWFNVYEVEIYKNAVYLYGRLDDQSFDTLKKIGRGYCDGNYLVYILKTTQDLKDWYDHYYNNSVPYHEAFAETGIYDESFDVVLYLEVNSRNKYT